MVYLLTLAQSLTYFFHYELWNGKPVSTDSLRIEWQLQGSMDQGINDWESTETIFDTKHVAGGWSVEGKRKVFRCFRFKRTRVNKSRKHRIYLSVIELYGTLFNV